MAQTEAAARETTQLVAAILLNRRDGVERQELEQLVRFIEANEAIFAMIRNGELAAYWDDTAQDLRLEFPAP